MVSACQRTNRQNIARRIARRTGGKIRLRQSLPKDLPQLEYSCVPGTISLARMAVYVALEVSPGENGRVDDFIVAVSEALTNAVIHGGGRAFYGIHRSDDCLSVRVEDYGQGIPNDLLCALVTQGGETTKDSSCEFGGYGYTVIKSFVDRAYIATGPQGTKVLLELAL